MGEARTWAEAVKARPQFIRPKDLSRNGDTRVIAEASHEPGWIELSEASISEVEAVALAHWLLRMCSQESSDTQ